MLIFILAISFASALTLEDYVSNLDTSFYDGTINITSFADTIVDSDSNGQNDTIIFNLTTDYSTSANFTANIFFEDEDLPIVSDTRSISSTNPSFIMNISTFFLSQSQYAYYARIYNEIGQIVYESRKYNTSTYADYETGTNITALSDENVNNALIRINVSLDVTKNETVNISVNLEYNDSIISATKETTLSSPAQVVSIDFDNETIKSTHFNGTLSVESVQIGNKIIEFSHNTFSYNYEDFAKTSYIKSIESSQIDNNSNNLSDIFRFNFTINVKSADDYTLEAALYDLDNNFIASLAKNETLSTGLQIVDIEIEGKDIYSTYYNGEFILSFAKLSIGNQTKDIVFDAHTTNITYYTDFERSPLPDLIISINTTFNETTNVTNVSIVINNTGEAPAFNIFVDVFDNASYENQSSVSFLDVNESKTFSFNAEETINESLFTAIVDFDNFVDEADESNNIVTNAKEALPSLTVSSFSKIYANDFERVFEFIIKNNGQVILDNINWTIDLGDGNSLNNTTPVNLTAGEDLFVYVQHNYSSIGSFEAIVYAFGNNLSANKTLQVHVGDLQIDSFELISTVNKNVVFEAKIRNDNAFSNLTGINWSINTGDGQVASADNLLSLAPNETAFIYTEHGYSQTGDYKVNFSTTNGLYLDTWILPIELLDIQASDLQLLNLTDRETIFEFYITNTLTINLSNVSWTIDTSDGLINSSTIFALGPNETAFVYAKHNFSTGGTFGINATAFNGTLSDSTNITIMVP
ncbi:hypothetical protein GOV09_05195 [Candidatus Woesearchaeota archaeon]|nr:hypothetical protein [Candidatus Woesearchaeota archaeon]